MNIGLMIAAAIVITCFIARRIWLARQPKSTVLPVHRENLPEPVLIPSLPALAEQADTSWWHSLEYSDKLHLAWSLINKCLPLWTKSTSAGEACYRNTVTGPLVRIDPQLLNKPADLIGSHLTQGIALPDEKMQQCSDDFVDPLIAMHDGNWAATYPIKKLFLAVYHMLKGVTSRDKQDRGTADLNLSISQSIDCLDMCRLYSKAEIDALLDSYRKIH